MAVPDNDQYSQDRRLAVEHYLEDRGGLKSEQIEFRSGSNPATNSPAVVGITNYPKTDTAGDNATSMTGH